MTFVTLQRASASRTVSVYRSLAVCSVTRKHKRRYDTRMSISIQLLLRQTRLVRRYRC